MEAVAVEAFAVEAAEALAVAAWAMEALAVEAAEPSRQHQTSREPNQGQPAEMKECTTMATEPEPPDMHCKHNSHNCAIEHRC